MSATGFALSQHYLGKITHITIAVPEKGAYLGAYIDSGDDEDDVSLDRVVEFEELAGKKQAIVASSSCAREGWPGAGGAHFGSPSGSNRIMRFADSSKCRGRRRISSMLLKEPLVSALIS